MFSVFFVDSTTGWAVGGLKGELERCGVIIKTIDGGETWVQQHDILSSPLTSVKFADSLSGWAVGWNGLILGTTNAGIDWVEQTKPTNWNLSSLAFVNDMTGWAVGARSTILKTNTAGMVTSVEHQPTSNIQKPEDFLLFQNYPNPFNPSTTIEFELKKTGKVKLFIYNVLGRTVRELVDDKLQAGRYSVVWDGSTDHHQLVGSGLYFLRMEARNSVSIRKLLLIR